jgi:hypothetical protein
VIIENPSGGDPTWQDADTWANHWDHDGDGTDDPPLDITVIADTDGGLWSMYAICPVTPQDQIMDQGMVNVDDACNLSNLCGTCGYNDTRVRNALDLILEPQSCGETTD